MDFASVFAPIGGFLPHGACYLWSSFLILFQSITDLIIAFSYLCIALVTYLIGLQKTSSLLKSPWVTVLFVNFIFFAALAHLISIALIWYPFYWLEVLVKLVTAIISGITAFWLYVQYSRGKKVIIS